MQHEEYLPIWNEAEWVRYTKNDPTAPQLGKLFKEQNGLIYRQVDQENQLWVPRALRGEVIKAFHEPPAMGHKGFAKLSQTMKEHVYWSGMDRDIQTYLKTCDICQRYKGHKQHIPMMNMPIPINCFDEVSMDVVGPVPTSSTGTRYILVIQDRLSRWIVFAAMRDQSSPTVIRTFLTKWIHVYGVPKKIITDRGTNFVAELTTELHNFLGVRPGKTTAYRPQGNGANERSHRELHQYIAMYVTGAHTTTWDTMLSMASWVHNSSIHETLKTSPYEIVTGLKPRSAKAWIPEPGINIEKMTEQFQDYYGIDKKKVNDLREYARKMINKAQTDFLRRYNKNAKELQLQVGDEVLLRNHKQSTYVARKWSPKYNGPFIIEQVISPAIVKIRHPETNDIDLVHTSYVRKYNTREPDQVEETEDEDIEPDYVELHPVPSFPPAHADVQQAVPSQQTTPASTPTIQVNDDSVVTSQGSTPYDSAEDLNRTMLTPKSRSSDSSEWETPQRCSHPENRLD